MSSLTKKLFITLFMFCLMACGQEGLVKVRILSNPGGEELGSFKAELADDPRERSMGLMFRNELSSDHAMLFIFNEDSLSPFWMQNTLIPLDILFVGADKKIVSIVAEAPPQTTDPRSPAGPYRYVLEIVGGRSEALGIHAGDQLEFNLP